MRGSRANISGRSCSAKPRLRWPSRGRRNGNGNHGRALPVQLLCCWCPPCSRLMFAAITWFALVLYHRCTWKVLCHFVWLLFVKLTAASYQFYLLSAPCHQYGEDFFIHQKVFFPNDKKKSLLTWMMMVQVLEIISLFIISQWRSKHSLHHSQELCTQYGIGPEADNLAQTSFIWGKRHCCFEFGISREQHHPSYLRRGRHLGGLHSRPSGKVNGTRWVVRWKDLTHRPCLHHRCRLEK